MQKYDSNISDLPTTQYPKFRIFRSERFYYWFLVCSLVLATLPICKAAEEGHKPSKTSVKKSSDPYCGLYCLYTVMKTMGEKVVFDDLLKPAYLGSRLGSTLFELKKAAENHGMSAEMAGKLTTRELRQSPYPIILHVKFANDKKRYDHYELFLGTKDELAILYDPPLPIKLVPFRELASRWDGNGLVLSNEPIDLGIVFAQARKQFIIYAAVAVSAILLVHWRRRQWLLSVRTISHPQLFGVSIVQVIGLTTIALLCGLVYHFANDEGFLANASATASVQKAHLGNFIPKVSKKKVQHLLSSDTVFIDARRTRDFKTGHLEGAINVPVDANDIERQEIMAHIPKDAHIVIYCQSNKCPYAEKTMIKLMTDGFSNISIFKGGWNEWQAKNGN